MNRAQMDNHMLEIARLFGVELDEEILLGKAKIMKLNQATMTEDDE